MLFDADLMFVVRPRRGAVEVALGDERAVHGDEQAADPRQRRGLGQRSVERQAPRPAPAQPVASDRARPAAAETADGRRVRPRAGPRQARRRPPSSFEPVYRTRNTRSLRTTRLRSNVAVMLSRCSPDFNVASGQLHRVFRRRQFRQTRRPESSRMEPQSRRDRPHRRRAPRSRPEPGACVSPENSLTSAVTRSPGAKSRAVVGTIGRSDASESFRGSPGAVPSTIADAVAAGRDRARRSSTMTLPLSSAARLVALKRT